MTSYQLSTRDKIRFYQVNFNLYHFPNFIVMTVRCSVVLVDRNSIRVGNICVIFFVECACAWAMTYSLSYALSFCFYTIPEVHTIQCILPLSGHGSTMHTLVVTLTYLPCLVIPSLRIFRFCFVGCQSCYVYQHHLTFSHSLYVARMLRLGLLCLALTLGSTFDLLGQDMIDYINKHENMTWTAGKNFAVSSLKLFTSTRICAGFG